MTDDIGLLVGCFRDGDASYCLVRPLQQMDLHGTAITNEYECPILTLTDLVYCIPSNSIYHSVSVIHECSHTCTFNNTSLASRRMEHENVHLSRSQLLYNHDLSNKLYCYNIYCMSLLK